MFTSLAPSPIASVTFFGNRALIMFTMSAFYFGDTLQAKTTSTISEADKKSSLSAGSASIVSKAAPATIMAYLATLDLSTTYLLASASSACN